MANKRMFTMHIVDSDAFLDMPLSTQSLYFHLNMRADDDGFIGNPKRVQRLIGASEDDLKLLIAKRFVLTFEDGVIVIKHWRMHNTIRGDRYTQTQYKDELSMLKTKDNNSYTLSNGGDDLVASRLPSGCQVVANVSPPDIGLDIDIDKDIYIPSTDVTGNTSEKTVTKKKTETKHKYGEYNHVLLKDSELEKLNSDYGCDKTEQAIKYLDEYIEMKGTKYKSHYLVMRKWVFEAVKDKAKSGAMQPQKQQQINNKFNNFQQRKYSKEDFRKMEQLLLNK